MEPYETIIPNINHKLIPIIFSPSFWFSSQNSGDVVQVSSLDELKWYKTPHLNVYIGFHVHSIWSQILSHILTSSTYHVRSIYNWMKILKWLRWSLLSYSVTFLWMIFANLWNCSRWFLQWSVVSPSDSAACCWNEGFNKQILVKILVISNEPNEI